MSPGPDGDSGTLGNAFWLFGGRSGTDGKSGAPVLLLNLRHEKSRGCRYGQSTPRRNSGFPHLQPDALQPANSRYAADPFQLRRQVAAVNGSIDEGVVYEVNRMRHTTLLHRRIARLTSLANRLAAMLKSNGRTSSPHRTKAALANRISLKIRHLTQFNTKRTEMRFAKEAQIMPMAPDWICLVLYRANGRTERWWHTKVVAIVAEPRGIDAPEYRYVINTEFGFPATLKENLPSWLPRNALHLVCRESQIDWAREELRQREHLTQIDEKDSEELGLEEPVLT